MIIHGQDTKSHFSIVFFRHLQAGKITLVVLSDLIAQQPKVSAGYRTHQREAGANESSDIILTYDHQQRTQCGAWREERTQNSKPCSEPVNEGGAFYKR